MTDEHTDTDTRSGDGDRHRTTHLEMDRMDLTNMTMTNAKTMKKKSKKVYVLHHTLQGTPERGEVHGIYPTKKSCLMAMKEELNRGYDGVTMRENEEQDYIYMYWSEQTLYTPNA